MVSASVYVIVFRILHVIAAIAWGGTVFLTVFFLQPTAQAIGPAAGPFMRELLGGRKMIDWNVRIAWVTIVAGGFLYWHDVQLYGDLGDFLGTAFGLWLTIGAISALIALGIGMFATRPTMERSLEVGGRIAAAEGPPPPELVREFQGLQARGRSLAKANLTFIAIAALAMATARYW